MRKSGHESNSRATAIRALFASPIILRRHNEDLFRLVATERSALEGWFEDNLGWRLQVDIRAGIARLHKRTQIPDARRGLRRTRSGRRAFDPLRYQLLALTCAELLRRPHTTLGDLADAIARVCALDVVLRPVDFTRGGDCFAFVDILLWLVDAGAVEVTAGEVEGFGGARGGDAVLVANTTLIPMLLSSDTAASRIEGDTPTAWIEQLGSEPRYGTAATDPENTDRDQRSLWARHQAIRRLLDDPAVDLENLHPAVRHYLFTPAGRDKALSAVEDAGLSVERHADVWLAVDPSQESTANTFNSGGRVSNVEQTAAILLSTLVPLGPDGRRRMLRCSIDNLRRALRDRLDATPGWARGFRDTHGIETLLAASLDFLEEFGLVRRDGADVVPRPAAARFAVRVRVDATDVGGTSA